MVRQTSDIGRKGRKRRRRTPLPTLTQDASPSSDAPLASDRSSGAPPSSDSKMAVPLVANSTLLSWGDTAREHTPPGSGVRNSWAASWGESGYVRLEMGQDTCGVALFACSAIP